MVTAGPKAFSGEIDLSNCFWCIRKPYHILSVYFFSVSYLPCLAGPLWPAGSDH